MGSIHPPPGPFAAFVEPDALLKFFVDGVEDFSLCGGFLRFSLRGSYRPGDVCRVAPARLMVCTPVDLYASISTMIGTAIAQRVAGLVH